MNRLLVCMCLSVLATSPFAQAPDLEVDRHLYRASCWHHWTGWSSDAIPYLAGLASVGERVLDVSAFDVNASWVRIVSVCGAGNPGSPFMRSHAVDSNVNAAGAVAVAQATGMMVTSLAQISNTSPPAFMSLRETPPAGIGWTLVPSRNPSGIQAWLSSNPSFQPYAVDVTVVGGSVDYYVFAMESLPGGPTLRTRTVHFGQPLASLPSGIFPRPNLVIDIAHDSLSTVAYVEEVPAFGDATPEIEVIDTLNEPPGNAQLERWFVTSSFIDSSGQRRHSALRVNNAWSLYDVHHYPPNGPFANYRGSPMTLGTATMSVSSTSPGVAEAGSTLTWTASPIFFGGLAYFMTSFERTAMDLGPLGAPGVFLGVLPTFVDQVFPSSGTIAASLAQPIPNVPGLNGIRFYVQAAIVEPGVFGTTNMFSVTIQ